MPRVRVVLFFTSVLCFAVPGLISSAWAKIPQDFRGVKLGMAKPQVVEILDKTPGHLSYVDVGGQLGEIIRHDRLFRYATYKFDTNGKLVEIALEMREILGREKVLEMFNKEHDLNLSQDKGVVEGDLLVEVKGNQLLMRSISKPDTRAAGAAPVGQDGSR